MAIAFQNILTQTSSMIGLALIDLAKYNSRNARLLLPIRGGLDVVTDRKGDVVWEKWLNVSLPGNTWMMLLTWGDNVIGILEMTLLGVHNCTLLWVAVTCLLSLFPTLLNFFYEFVVCFYLLIVCMYILFSSRSQVVIYVFMHTQRQWQIVCSITNKPTWVIAKLFPKSHNESD